VRLLTYKELLEKIGTKYSRRQIARLEQAGRFPRRYKFGDSQQAKIAWVEKDIEKWLEAAKRRGGAL
jgi:predicted DNA-binding transcriptional regulator AlpA